jgi:uncharacterized membrane protein (DUF4010 family)
VESFVLSTAVALGIGLLIGVERERSKGGGPDREIAGVRTFALAALLGIFGALLDRALLLAVLASLIGALAIAGYLRRRETDPGITTEVALITTFALGALSLPYPEYSAGAAVAVTVLLASRPWLHELVTSRLTDRELHDGLLLAAAALVILPLLPDRTIDPWDTLNPRKMWIVVVLVMTINAIGYVGLRIWGPSKGLALAGVLGGLVSSVSTHGAMGQRAKEQAAIAGNAAAAATFSSVTTAVFLLTVVGAVNVPLAMSLLAPCVSAALVSAGYGWLLFRRSEQHESADLARGRPVSLRAALIFGGVVSGVLVLSALLSRTFGPGAALASVAAAGFADAHSGAISAATLAGNEVLSVHAGQIAVLLSFTTNAMTKIVVSALTGPRGYLWRVAGGIVASVSAAWLVWWLFSRS